MKRRVKRIKKATFKILQILSEAKLTRPELLVVLGQVLVHVGYTVYYKLESQEEPPGKMTPEQAKEMFCREPTLGTQLMKLGFEFQGRLLNNVEEEIRKAGR